MKKMAAGAFKVHCLAVMDEVQAKPESLLITKHGKPVVKLVPADGAEDDIYDFLAGKGPSLAMLFRPRFRGEEWGDVFAQREMEKRRSPLV
jgi:prevent-host-death family protein